jgi:hypothetical protein
LAAEQGHSRAQLILMLFELAVIIEFAFAAFVVIDAEAEIEEVKRKKIV